MASKVNSTKLPRCTYDHFFCFCGVSVVCAVLIFYAVGQSFNGAFEKISGDCWFIISDCFSQIGGSQNMGGQSPKTAHGS